jgi:hypothetical protein
MGDGGDKLMAYENDDYNPNAKSRQILDLAWQFVMSVPYQVTARWLFYKLLPSGFYRDKKDYNGPFLGLLSRVRHNNYQGWRPDTLADDRREATVRGDGFESPADWARAVSRGLSCNLSHWHHQRAYVEVWFEAQAMRSQFEYYTRGVTLCPFSGMPSIDYKWTTAKRLEEAARDYGLDVKILYFGDLDRAGLLIPETSVADIRKWCAAPFEFIRVGLNPGDEVRYSIPENFEHPGAYQWEALSDDAARELITGAMTEHVDENVRLRVVDLARQAEREFAVYARGFKCEAAWGA